MDLLVWIKRRQRGLNRHVAEQGRVLPPTSRDLLSQSDHGRGCGAALTLARSCRAVDFVCS